MKMLDSGFEVLDIEIPKEENFGDLSTPIAMGLAKKLKRPPKKIAEEIVKAIIISSPPLIKGSEGVLDIFEKVEIAGPGFINFTFTRDFLSRELSKLIKERDLFFFEDLGEGRRVQIEFVSANPTGPLHLGHGRGAAVGGALSNLLAEAGYNVEREYYINDAGRQVRLLGMSVFAKYNHLLGLEYSFPEDGYRGDYIEGLARELLGKYGKEFAERPFDEVSDVVVDFSYKRMLEDIRRDLEDFGVSFDAWQSERVLYQDEEVSQAIDDLKNRGFMYEKDGALWFRSSTFGDDKDRVVIKKDGEYTYFASDIAYHRKKVERGYDEIIDIWGADHHGYIQRVQAVIQALGYPKEGLRILLVQMVTLLKGGTPVQMSKRAGEFITLREVMDEIGPDTTKFLFLTRRSDSHLEIDIDVAKAQSPENPVFYVQYAHARINSIFEKARRELRVDGPQSEVGSREAVVGNQESADERQESVAGTEELADFKGELFNEDEMRILKRLLLYPMILKNAALAHEPHRITFYLQEIAGMFHPYYHKYRVISDDRELTRARLALCESIRIVLQHGLKLLGVKAPEKM